MSTIAKDTDKMSSWGLGDVLYMALENEKEKREHKREMEKLENIKYIQQQQNQQQKQPQQSGKNILDNDLIKYGGIALGGLLVYKLIA